MADGSDPAIQFTTTNRKVRCLLMSTNKQLKKIIEDFNKQFQIVSENSRNDYISTLKANETVPAKGKIYGDSYRASFKKDCEKINADAAKLIDDEIYSLSRRMSLAPSQDAVNAVQMLSMRTNISDTEIQKMLNRYGDNDMARSTIIDIAGSHGNHNYDFERPGTEERIQDLEGLKSSLKNAFTDKSAENRGIGFYSILNAEIDSLFPEE